MSLLLWIGLWCLMWLVGTDLLLCKIIIVAKEERLLLSTNRTLYGGHHLRRGNFNMTELNTTQLTIQQLRSSHDNCRQQEHVVGFLTCLIRDHTLSPFIFFIFTLGFFGNRILFFFLLFRINWNPFAVHIWNYAVSEMAALAYLCRILLFFSVDYILGDSRDDLAMSFLSLAYLFVFVLCTTSHFLMAISVDWCLGVLFPTYHPRNRPMYVSDVISATVSALLWALSSLLLFFLYVGADPYDITIVSFIFFAPLTVSLTLSLLLKVWRNLDEQGKLHKEILLAMLFCLVTLVPLRLFFTLHKYLEAVPSLVLMFMALSSTNAPLHYMIVWKLGLPSP